MPGMPSPAELKTVGDDSCSTLEEEEQQMIMQNNKKIIIIISIVFNDVKIECKCLFMVYNWTFV